MDAHTAQLSGEFLTFNNEKLEKMSMNRQDPPAYFQM